MPPKRKDFIGFVSDAATDEELAREFLSKNTAKKLYNFFRKREYTDIEEERDCAAILAFRTNMQRKYIPPFGKDPCPDHTMGY
jgi:hypothetical protein